jgi:4'-phosphopantetheinyl transferase EntD
MDIGIGLSNVFSHFSSHAPDGASLIGVEREASKGFGEKRLADFLTGRHCARMALMDLGIDGGEIPVGEGRQPIWPMGVSGSISHANGLTGAILARREHHPSLGLDIERRRSVDGTLWKHLFTDADSALLETLGEDTEEWATLFFSLKETFYKLQYPISGRFLDFIDVSLVRMGDGYRVVWKEDIELPDILDNHRLGYLFTDGHVVTYGILKTS